MTTAATGKIMFLFCHFVHFFPLSFSLSHTLPLFSFAFSTFFLVFRSKFSFFFIHFFPLLFAWHDAFCFIFHVNCQQWVSFFFILLFPFHIALHLDFSCFFRLFHCWHMTHGRDKNEAEWSKNIGLNLMTKNYTLNVLLLFMRYLICRLRSTMLLSVR